MCSEFVNVQAQRRQIIESIIWAENVWPFFWYLPNLFTWSALPVPKYHQFRPVCPDLSLIEAPNNYCSSTIHSTNSAFQLGADGSLVSHRESNFRLFCRNLILWILEPDCQGNTDLCYPFDFVNQKIDRFDSEVGKLGDVTANTLQFYGCRKKFSNL